jgi:NAD(P)-dependent dehydrogenase (short-subunit alcohol dehydrogenase family)
MSNSFSYNFDFKGRVAWVTGAASGMGANHALRLARAGCRVGIIDVDGERLGRVSRMIEAEGHEARGETGDVSDWPDLSRAANCLLAALGPPNIVVANAGILGAADAVADLDPADWARVIAVNLTGVFHTCKAAIPHMMPQGTLILVSSVSGLRGYAGASAYNASKHGVIGLMRTLANELSDRGIRVNAICPGWVDTPMFDRQVQVAGLDRAVAEVAWSRDQLLERLVTPDEVSDAVLWLASPLAAMVTAIALPIDGGLAERTLPASG